MKHTVTISFLFILVSVSTGFTQNPEWTYYRWIDCNIISALAEEEDYMWVGLYERPYDGGGGGLIRIEKTTGNATHYTTTNSGLPDKNVAGIGIDALGNKWIGTGLGGGLARFDGTNWTAYDYASSGLLGDIYAIVFDSSGNMWVLASSTGLVKYDGTNWKVFDVEDFPWMTYLSRFYTLAADNSGNIWVWMGWNWNEDMRQGLAKFDGTDWTVYDASNTALNTEFVISMAIDSSGDVWIGTLWSGLARFDGVDWIIYDTSNSKLPNNCVTSVEIDTSGNKWIGTGRWGPDDPDSGGGLVKFDGTNWTVYNTSNSNLPGNQITAMKLDNYGDLWAGTYDNGLIKFDGTDWKNPIRSSLPSNTVYSITVDPSGNTWTGTSAGLAKFDGTDWTVYHTSNSNLPDNRVNAISIDASGDKWIGTYGYGLVKFNGTDWTAYTTSNSELPDNHVNAIAFDKTGNMWIAVKGGLAKRNGEHWIQWDPAGSGLPGNVTSLAFDASGDTWFGSANGGLARFDGTTATVYDSANSGLPDNDVTSIAIDAFGNKWIGTYNHGLVKFDGTNWTTFNVSNSGLSDNCVKSVTIDACGNKWIGTKGEGVAVLNDGGAVRSINRTDKIAPNTHYAINSCWTQHSAHISYTVPRYGHVSINIFDIKGRTVKTLVNGMQTSGSHHISFNAETIAKGTYLICLQSDDISIIRKLTFLK